MWVVEYYVIYSLLSNKDRVLPANLIKLIILYAIPIQTGSTTQKNIIILDVIKQLKPYFNCDAPYFYQTKGLYKLIRK